MALYNDEKHALEFGPPERPSLADRTAKDSRFNETTTKREMFAAMAMQAIMTHPDGIWTQAASNATLAVAAADALIAALEKQ